MRFVMKRLRSMAHRPCSASRGWARLTGLTLGASKWPRGHAAPNRSGRLGLITRCRTLLIPPIAVLFRMNSERTAAARKAIGGRLASPRNGSHPTVIPVTGKKKNA